MAIDTSSVIYVGEGYATLIETYPYEIDIDEVGLTTHTVHYECKFRDALALVKRLRRHPDFFFLLAKKAKINRKEAGMCEVTVDYEGVDPAGGFDGGSNKPRYTVEGNTTQDPIETHPDFLEFAGNWKNKLTWKNGAVFVEKKDDAVDYGKFLGFRPDPNIKDLWAGMLTYFNGSFIFGEEKTIPETSVGSAKADMSKLGYIDVPPKSRVMPKFEADRNFLLITCNITEVGEGVKVTRKWILSGRGGFLKPVYEKKKAAK